MKFIHLALTSALFLGFFVSLESTQAQEIVTVEAEKIFIPTGFDDNDVAQIVSLGHFNSTCYRSADPKIDIDTEKFTIHIGLQALKYEEPCEQIRNKFVKVIDLGILPSGVYTIIESNQERGTLNIKHTESKSRDDFLYAPIHSAEIYFDPRSEEAFMELRSAMPNSCYHLREENIQIVHKSARVIEILPILERDSRPNAECTQTRTMLRRVLSFPDKFDAESYLFHIRTMNGESLNLVESRSAQQQ